MTRPIYVGRGLCICLLALIIGNLCPWTRATAADRERFITGQLLVATPEMKDSRFFESVIYMVKHDAKGAMGLVINKPIARGLIDDVLKSSGRATTSSPKEMLIHYGGPVGSRQGFLLHSDDYRIDSTTNLSHGISMTADVKMLEALAAGKGPSRWLFMLGYAGWAPRQLEGELKTGSWFVLSSDQALIFGDDATRKWHRAMDKRQIPL